MKKLLLGLAVIGMITLVGCSKEKDCECVSSQDGMDDVTQTVTIEDGDCADMDQEVTTGGMTLKTVCKEV